MRGMTPHSPRRLVRSLGAAVAAVALACAGVAPAAAQSLPTGSLGSSGGSPVAPVDPVDPGDPTFDFPPTVSTTSVADLRSRFTGPDELVHQGFLAPGMKVFTLQSSSRAYQCTAGFIGTKGGVQYMITAGHCGTPGQDVYIQHPSGSLKTSSHGNMAKIGTYEKSISSVGTGQDWAVVRLSPGAVPVSTAFGGEVELAGVMSQSDAQRAGTTLCLLGSTTGLQCGAPHNSGTTTMLGIEVKAKQGDSGGPVVALRDGKLYAVAVTSVQMFDIWPNRYEFTAAYPVAQVATDNGITL